MGLFNRRFGGLLGWALDLVAKAFGKLVNGQPFFSKYKGPIGGVFLAAWAWSWYQGCPDLLWGAVDIDKYTWFHCDQFKSILSHLGAFLVGAGVLESDNFKKNGNGNK